MPKEDVTVTRGASSRTKLRESFDEAARNFTDLFVGKSVQGAPHAATVSATLTAAQLLTRIITVNQGGAAASELTLPLATAMDTGFSDAGADGAFDFNVINISTVAAEDATILTNTGWTLVGEMTVESNDADRARSAGHFRARRTGAGAWTLYRIA
jgi:hypothetical protein